jgi:hypothetical protein
MRSFARSPLWPWAKVVVLLVVLDWALFGAGLFFRWVPQIRRFPITWGLVYRCVQQLQTAPEPPLAYAVGSSIVFLGLDERRVRGAMAERQVPSAFETLTVFGAFGVDQALLAHAAIPTHPWLVVLTASVRDFPAQASLDTPVSRVFFDSSVALPAAQPTDVEGRLAAIVRRHWMLYRYRFFVRTALDEATTPLFMSIAPKLAKPLPAPGPLQLPSASGAPVPEEASQWFFPGRLTAESWAAWKHWRETRRFADYEDFLNVNRSGAIEQYGRQTFATHGPERNVHLDAIAWSTEELRAAAIRVVVLDFPENPVLEDPEARALYDTTLSDAVARRLEQDATARGARFVDLRHVLDAEDFYDLIHPNVSGSRKLSDRLGAIVAEEWKAAGR